MSASEPSGRPLSYVVWILTALLLGAGVLYWTLGRDWAPALVGGGVLFGGSFLLVRRRPWIWRAYPPMLVLVVTMIVVGAMEREDLYVSLGFVCLIALGIGASLTGAVERLREREEPPTEG